MADQKPTSNPSESTQSNSNSRRQFLKTGSAFAALAILPSGTRLNMLNSKLRTAHIGVGGMGKSDLNSIASHKSVEVAALCDVDSNPLKAQAARFKNAKTFADFREMFSEMKDSIDGVVVSTPDHTHAPAAMTAMNLDKHVYCQKPLTHEIYEARKLVEIARKKKVVTQMGIQIHSKAVYRRAFRMIRAGWIGKVSEVHAWSNKNWGYDGPAYEGSQEPPKNLDWDLWLGTAPERGYVPRVYHPGNWRKIIDFGTGTLGDMGVHIFDTPFDALNLKTSKPKTVMTKCRKPNGFGHPEANRVEIEFSGTKYTTESLKWVWRDGRSAVPKVTEFGLPLGTTLPGQGALLKGEIGTMVIPHIGEAQVYLIGGRKEKNRPRVVDRDHYHQWVTACLGSGNTTAPFSFGGPLTEALLLGVIANRFPNEKLEWDWKNMEFTNNSDATALVKRNYREEFKVENL